MSMMLEECEPAERTEIAKRADRLEKLTKRLEQVETDVELLKQKAERQRKLLQSFSLAIVALVAFLVIAYVKGTLPRGKMKLDVSKLIANDKQPPYYLLFAFSIMSSIIEILVLGAPPLKSSGETSRVKFSASQAYQLYLVAALIFNVYLVVSKTCAFTLESWGQEDSTVIVILNTLMVFALHLVAGPLMSDGCKIYALFQATIQQVKFARAHDTNVFRDPDKLYPGDKYVSDKLVEVNGPIFRCYLTMVWVGYPIGQMILALLAAPALLAYCWFIVPLGVVLYVLVHPTLNLLLRCAFSKVPEDRREPITMFDVEVTELRTEEGDGGDNLHMKFIMDNSVWVRGRTVQDRYKRAISTLYNTNLTYSAWYIYLLVSVTMQMLVSFLVVLGVRLFSGFGYIETLTCTIGERHWYLYMRNLQGSAVDAISAFTQAF